MQHAKIRYLLGLCLGLLLIFVPSLMALKVAGQQNNQSVQAAPLLAPNALPTVSFTSASYSQSEGAGTANISVQVSSVPTQTIVVEYLTRFGSATSGVDYVDTSGVLTFTIGSNPNTPQTFSVTINEDTIDEPDETLSLILRNPVNATLGATSEAILTITDNDLPPTPTRTPTTGAPPVFSDAYEPNNTFSSATDIAAGQRFCNLTLWPTGDEDYFQFVGKAGSRYQIFTDALEPGLDTVLTVYDPQGNVLAMNDDFTTGNRRSEVEIDANTDGFYFARVINQDPSDPADRTYCFEVKEIQPATSTPQPNWADGDDCEFNSLIEYACLIGVGETNSFDFVPTTGSEQDTDIYRLWIKAGIEYTCETLNLSTYADTNIILWDQNGNPFNPWIGNDDKESTGDTPEFGSKVTYLARYTGWLHIVVGPANVFDYEESYLQTYDLRCTSSAATATPTPTATFVPAPPGGGTGGTLPTNTPVATPTEFVIVFPTPLPTATPFELPTNTPTATPPIIQFQPLPTATPQGGSTGQTISINVTLFYDVNNNYTPELTEGIANVAVYLYDAATGALISFSTTNEIGVSPFTGVSTTGPVRIVVPFLAYNQVIIGGNTNLLLRIAPPPLPIGIP